MKIVFAYMIFFTTAGFANIPYQEITDTSHLTILSPSLQKRSYGKILLKNGIKAYLISDPEAEQSACAVAIHAGSWDDPKSHPGTAHLLEHMLFLGTEKYPTSNGFSSFLSDHNGLHNAYTAPNLTVYLISVYTSHFDEGLDRFADFFTSPLLKQELIASELVKDSNCMTNA